MRRIVALIPVLAAFALGAPPAMAQSTLSAPISQQSIANDGNPHVVGTVSFTAITPVSVAAGQDVSGDVSSFTLRTDTAPSTFPASGTIAIRATDPVGNGYIIGVTYTGTSAAGFTGVNVTSGNVTGLLTTHALANPLMTGSISINRTGSGSLPWLNTLTSASNLTILFQSSADGGTTWQDEDQVSTPGGVFTDKNNNTVTTSGLDVGPINPVADAVRMICIATGSSPIEISGTATVLTR